MSEMGMAMMGSGVSAGEERAKEAAESAISSPLLEDVNLVGACGVLVNVTAGMDMSIGEFEEVGEVIRSFTSENATVVVGTVIDPEMTDELRVTVVVTGLGDGDDAPHDAKAPASVSVAVQSETNQQDMADSEPVHNDMPSSSQEQDAKEVVSQSVADAAQSSQVDYQYLDIPAFLRKKMLSEC